jgi:hypothetical protein
VSDFLPFATGAGANVETQAAYAGDPATSAGFSAGIAASAKLNKAWRQSSFVAAGVAQLVMQQLGIDVLDNGNLPAFVANLQAALLSLNPRLSQPPNSTMQFWVNAATGLDTYPGTSPSLPWQTLQQAATWISDHVDANDGQIIVNIEDGVYAPFFLETPVIGVGNPKNLLFQGDLATPSNVIIQSTTGVDCVFVGNSSLLELQGMRFVNPGGHAVHVQNYARIRYANCDFGPVNPSGSAHLYLEFHAQASMVGNCTISGGAASHIHARANSNFITFNAPLSYTLIGTPAFGWFIQSGGNCYISMNDYNDPGYVAGGRLSFQGTGATGGRWWVHSGSVIETLEGNSSTLPTYFPGSTAGFTDASTYGVYEDEPVS